MTTLCLDAGNSRLKWGLYDQRTWLAQGVLGHEQAGQLATMLPQRPQHILACNVAGPVATARIEQLAAALDTPLDWFASCAFACGVRNGYERPEQLGADRWAALIGARSLHAGPALVVMAGTATTIDMLDADGTFRGGVILPGLDLMCASLARNTAGLPEARGQYRAHPANTDDAIVTGSLHATLGAIERMRRLDHPAADADRCCVLSGGAADMLTPHLASPVTRIENLVLEGLARTIW